MSTGTEHYRVAEQLLREAGQLDASSPSAWHAQMIAEAQVHATLALAAATALHHYWPTCELREADRIAWRDAAGMAAPISGDLGDDPIETSDYDPGPQCDDQGGWSEISRDLAARDEPDPFDPGPLPAAEGGAS